MQFANKWKQVSERIVSEQYQCGKFETEAQNSDVYKTVIY